MTMYKGEKVTAMIGVARTHNGRFVNNFYIDINFIDIALRDDGLMKFCNKDATAEHVINYAFNEAVHKLIRSDYMDKFPDDEFVVIDDYWKTAQGVDGHAEALREGRATVSFDARHANITFGTEHSDFIKWNMNVNREGADYLYLYNDWGSEERIAKAVAMYGDADGASTAEQLTGWLCMWHGFTKDLGDYDVVTTAELNAIIRKRPKLVGDRLVKRMTNEYDVETEAKIANIVETLREQFDTEAVKLTGTSISKATFNWIKEELTQAVTKSANYKVLH